jgi:hypothetical protein
MEVVIDTLQAVCGHIRNQTNLLGMYVEASNH